MRIFLIILLAAFISFVGVSYARAESLIEILDGAPIIGSESATRTLNPVLVPIEPSTETLNLVSGPVYRPATLDNPDMDIAPIDTQELTIEILD
jgi:hypothetical protein